MPPFVPRKRERDTAVDNDTPTSQSDPPAKKPKTAPPRKKASHSVFDAIDQPPDHTRVSIEEKKRLLQRLHSKDDDDSSLSEAESLAFEDVEIGGADQYGGEKGKISKSTGPAVDSDEADEDEFDWENAIPHVDSHTNAHIKSTHVQDHEIGDISISVNDDNIYIEPTVSAGVIKKGPSKREREFRISAHCLHVQCLMRHNSIRNAWLNDKKIQTMLVDGLTEGVKKEVFKWKDAMGQLSTEELEVKKAEIAARNRRKKGRRSGQNRGERDWHYNADTLEQGQPDLSHGDPVYRLLKVLTAYWRKRFLVTAPGIRKEGYKDPRRLRDETRGWAKNKDAVDDYGERIQHLKDFRELARKCEGSRDVGAQLFIALLRGIGLQVRMVANLQPIGFGWSKAEDALPRRARRSLANADAKVESTPVKVNGARVSKLESTPVKKSPAGTVPSIQPVKGAKADPITLDDSDSTLSSVPGDQVKEDDQDTADDASIVEIMPPPREKRSTKKYDRDLAYPVYWAEVCSSISHKFIPVDAVVLSTIASNDDLLQSFEPRGKKAELSKQVICYTVAYNADGTAKDVTIRYLKRHQLPGKTKGFRMPAERIPILNRKGKVLKYEDYDWFKRVMLSYERPDNQRTAADELEENTDLKPLKIASQAAPAEKESLQWYKQSAEFVLEQHLRREEALLPDAEPVRTFSAGKGDKVVEHPVFLRSDVVVCKTVESWHKEGRALLPNQHPMKLVPIRAVTLIRKREIEDAQRETGEKPQQGLYSREQTDWIIPDPIQNGVIPKNAFGNIDVYVPTMVPEGAIHLPLKGSAKLCRKLEIDYAEACTGFEFGKQRAVPVLTGVVVAQEHARIVRDAWKVDQAERKRKEDTKRTALTLQWWRKMLLGLRVIERMRIEYQGVDLTEQEINPFVARAKRSGRLQSAAYTDPAVDDNSDQGGGFLKDSDEELEDGSRFDHEDGGGGGFIVDEENVTPARDFEVGDDPLDQPNGITAATIQPKSLQSVHQDAGDIENIDKEGLEELSEVGNMEAKSVSVELQATHRSATKRSDPIRTMPKTKNQRLKTKPTTKTTPAKRGRRKATPTKSRYFMKEESEDHDMESVASAEDGPKADNVGDGNDTAEEVIAPRRTTARTRSKK